MGISTIAEKKVDAVLLDEDLKSGKLAFDKGMARVAEAAADALAAFAAKGAGKVKGTHGAKSGVNSEVAEEGEEKIEKLDEDLVSTDPKEIAKQANQAAQEMSAVDSVSTADLGGATDTVMGMTLGLGVKPLDILPYEDLVVEGLQGKS